MFVNLVETDMLWGHRNDPVNFHRCLQDFDRRLTDILDALRPGDLLVLTLGPRLRPDDAEHGPHPRARAAARLRRGPQRERARARGGRVRRRRCDRERVARRKVAGAGDPGPLDLRRVIRPAELIQRKRDGGELDADEIAELVLGYARDEVPDYQMAAFCMAVFFRGLTPAETFAFTDAMVRSGDTLDLHAALGRTVVDKHSTGGVGDKTTIAVGPIVAACGVPFGKMSGRGLGHTGGTLDKLEAIPGFRVELSEDEFVAQIKDVGLAIIGQTGDLVPADKRLYALRDVTATVDNVQLIAASIMSKKIAAGADAIVLDVKVGDGAFMKTLERGADARRDDARASASARAAASACLLTDMDQPLGRAVGNALELTRRGRRSSARGPTTSPSSCSARRRTCSRCPTSRSTSRKAARGRRPRSATGPRSSATSAGSARRAATRARTRCRGRRSCGRSSRRSRATSGALRALPVGIAALELGAGRARKDDAIDHAVGVVCLRKRGDEVERGEPLAEIHARTDDEAAAAAERVLGAYELGDRSPPSTVSDRARRPCLSCLKSRPSARASSRSSPDGPSSTSRSATGG